MSVKKEKEPLMGDQDILTLKQCAINSISRFSLGKKWWRLIFKRQHMQVYGPLVSP